MKLDYSKAFLKSFNKLTVKEKKKVRDRLNLFVEDEYSVVLKNHKLHGEYSGCRSINISGDVRVVYKELGNGIRYLIDIGTHSYLYE